MKALLIEDEPAIAEALAEGLVAEGFVTETAGNGLFRIESVVSAAV